MMRWGDEGSSAEHATKFPHLLSGKQGGFVCRNVEQPYFKNGQN